MATLSKFRTQFPEFAATVDADVERWLAEASSLHSVNDVATLWCAAHLLALAIATGLQPDEGAGEVKEETIGPKSLIFKTQAEAGWEVFFTRSSYGRHFLLLERRTPAVGFSVRVF